MAPSVGDRGQKNPHGVFPTTHPTEHLRPCIPRAPLDFWDQSFARCHPFPVCSVNMYGGPAPCQVPWDTCSWP